MLEELLGSKVRARMIAALLIAPDQCLHLRALVRSAGGSVASVQREIERLGDMGLLHSETDEQGRRQVSLVGDHPFAPALAGLVAADPRAQYGARVAAVPNLDASVAEALGGWVDAIVTGFDPIKIVLFGSQAKGTADAGSDVDLLVVLPEVIDELETAVRIMSAIGPRTIGVDVIPINPVQLDRSRTRLSSAVRDAIEEGVVLYERAG
jgi:predicted nucleotidyltransferase